MGRVEGAGHTHLLFFLRGGVGGVAETGEAVGGGVILACLNHLSIEQASLSRRSTVPNPKRYLQQLGAQYRSSIYIHVK